MPWNQKQFIQYMNDTNTYHYIHSACQMIFPISPQHKSNFIELCVSIFHQLKILLGKCVLFLFDILELSLLQEPTETNRKKNFSHVPNLVNDARLNEKESTQILKF